jgi:hypothetical protein
MYRISERWQSFLLQDRNEVVCWLGRAGKWSKLASLDTLQSKELQLLLVKLLALCSGQCPCSYWSHTGVIYEKHSVSRGSDGKQIATKELRKILSGYGSYRALKWSRYLSATEPRSWTESEGDIFERW